MFGQSEVETDNRGVVVKAEANQIRKLRAQEQWERIDSIVVGEGASALSRGWFDSFALMAGAANLVWFSGRDPSVGPAYTNQDGERTDFAQDIYQVTVQAIIPVGQADLESNSNDASTYPLLFAQFLSALSLRVVLSESDEIANAPADHFPGSFGIANLTLASQPAQVTYAGTNGEAIVSNSWKFPEPIMLAAKSRITVKGLIDRPYRDTFAALVGPGHKVIPTGNPAAPTVNHPNWYTIRMTMRGPRYLQLRGARSSA